MRAASRCGYGILPHPRPVRLGFARKYRARGDGCRGFLLWCVGYRAQLIAVLPVGPAHPIHAVMIAMLLRMVPPLALCAAVGLRRGPLTDAGMVFYMIGFYLVTLAVDTCLSVSRISPAVSPRRG